jgi:hypothetical protein
MAFSNTVQTVASFFASWAEAGGTISVPVASLPEVTAAEAHGTTGDIRKVLWAICAQAYAAFMALAAADKPAKCTIAKSTSSAVNATSGAVTVTHKFTFTFVNTIATEDVQAE